MTTDRHGLTQIDDITEVISRLSFYCFKYIV